MVFCFVFVFARGENWPRGALAPFSNDGDESMRTGRKRWESAEEEHVLTNTSPRVSPFFLPPTPYAADERKKERRKQTLKKVVAGDSSDSPLPLGRSTRLSAWPLAPAGGGLVLFIVLGGGTSDGSAFDVFFCFFPVVGVGVGIVVVEEGERKVRGGPEAGHESLPSHPHKTCSYSAAAHSSTQSFAAAISALSTATRLRLQANAETGAVFPLR